MIFEYFHTVRHDEIDELGHANNLEYVKWLLAAAMAHSTNQGWPASAYLELGAGWVVRAHHIEYRRPAFAGQQVVVRTWISAMSKVTCTRTYQIYRLEDDSLLVEAETEWAFVKYSTGSPTRIPPEVASSFPIPAKAVPNEPA